MRIQQLVLENFRGFEKLEMDFPEGEGGLVVLVGVNGSGKTSILEGIGGLLNTFINELKNEGKKSSFENKSPIQFHSDYVKNGEKRGLAKINFEFLNKPFSQYWNLASDGINIRTSGETRIKAFQEFKNILSSNLWLGAPIIAYYSADRSVSEPQLKVVDLKNYLAFNIYDELLNLSIDFNHFFDWFRSMEDLENQKRLNEDSSHKENSLEAVRESLSNFIGSVKNPRVERSFPERLTIEKGGEKFSFQQLSHGERLIIAMIGDIARKLSFTSGEPLKAHGIVLIDEIELHLHPAWQRKIIPALRRTFPNVQFIVTTHSPQVISTVPKENVFILEDFKLVEKTPFTKGRDSNNLLYNIFGVEERPKIAKEDFQKLYDFLDEENIEKVRANIKEMEAKYGEDDPDIIEAKGHIKDFFELD